jgi:hypothetical protein
MLYIYDQSIARQRHEELLREAEKVRLVRGAAKFNGAAQLLSRMVNLLSRSGNPSQHTGRLEGTLNHRQLADA